MARSSDKNEIGMTPEYILKATDLTYSYRKGAYETDVLRGANFSVREGEMVAILGPSGSGKSTLLHLLGCLMRQQGGELVIDGVDVSSLDDEELAFFRSRELGFVFQKFYLLPRATVLQNMLLAVRYPAETASPSKLYRERALKISKQLGLSHRLHHTPASLSGGEQQRVAIGRALMNNCRILMADEPTGNLDSTSSAKTLQLIRRINEDHGQTVIMITHDEGVAAQAHRRVRFQDGRIVAEEELRPMRQNSPATVAKPYERPKSYWRYLPRLFRNLLPNALANILRNKLRTALTMLGVIIGIGAIVVLATLSQFAKIHLVQSLSSTGAKAITIYGIPSVYFQRGRQQGGKPVLFRRSYTAFRSEDLAALKSTFPQIQYISPLFEGYRARGTATYLGRQSLQTVVLQGVGYDYFKITNQHLAMGYYPSERQNAMASGVCVIGHGLYEDLFGGMENPLGKTVSVKAESEYSCAVIGVLKEQGKNLFGSDPNYMLYAPYTYMRNNTANFFYRRLYKIILGVHETQQTLPVSQAIKRYFRAQYGATGRFIVASNVQLIHTINTVLNVLTVLLGMVAAVSLVVAGVGLSNMMLASIHERLKEIGLIKAMGATNLSVRLLFIVESLILCFVAGMIGLVIGFFLYEGAIAGVSLLVPTIHFSVFFFWPAILASFGSIVLVGVLSGLFPALHAEKIDVITALQSE